MPMQPLVHPLLEKPGWKRVRRLGEDCDAVVGADCGLSAVVEGNLLTVDEAAELLGTSVRFPRRLIAERRIRFVRVGRHVRIAESAIEEYVAATTVEPIPRRARGVA
jgi:excisionase family DNA binding protein